MSNVLWVKSVVSLGELYNSGYPVTYGFERCYLISMKNNRGRPFRMGYSIFYPDRGVEA